MAPTRTRAPLRRVASPAARWLGELSPAQLERIVARRCPPGQPSTDLEELAAILASPRALGPVLMGLDTGARQVLEAVLVAGDGAPIEQVGRLLGGPGGAPGGPSAGSAPGRGGTAGSDLLDALERLEEAALVLAEGGVVRLVGAALAQLPHPAGLGGPAESLHARTNADSLRRILRNLGVTPRRGNTRAGLLRDVVGAIGDPSVLASVLKGGPEGTEGLAAAARDNGLLQFSGAYYHLQDREPLGWLVNRGVLVGASWSVFEMPRETALALRGGRLFPDLALRPPALVPGPEVAVGQVEAAAAEAAQAVVARLGGLLEVWQRAPAAQLKDGGVGVREIRRVAKALRVEEREAATLIELADVAGLLGVARAGDAVMPSEAADGWLDADLAERWRALVEGWVGCDIHLSLAGAIATNDKPIPALLPTAHPAVGGRRRAVLETMAAIPAGQVPTRESLSARLEWAHPTLLAGGPAPPPVLVDWTLGEAEMLGLAAGGCLSAAGRALLDEGAQAAAAVLALRLPPLRSTFVIQPDLSAVAPGRLAAAVRAEMELLADVESTGAATVYRFGEASLRRALDAGRSAAQIESFLSEHAERGVPQALLYMVADLGRRHGTLRSGRAISYLRSDDPALLGEVIATRRLAGLGLRALAPTVAVSEREPAEIVSALRAAGFLPAAEGPDGALVLERPAPTRARHRLRPVSAGPAVPTFSGSSRGAGSQDVSALAELAEILGLSDLSDLDLDDLEDVVLEDVVLEDVVLEDVVGDGAGRPTHIAKSRPEVLELLEDASEEDWMVRLSYVNSRGRESQVVGSPMVVGPRRVILAVWPNFASKELVTSRIAWVRVLTEAEEENQ
ncbi:MAG: helicase-associated domain-containing protein [Acidimicrobiales bacterium]